MAMENYSKYSCSHMLKYIEERSRELGRDNHIDYFLSMQNVNSIEELMEIYNNLFKFLAILFFGTNKVPKKWYVPEISNCYNRTLYIEELNTYSNECILKWFRRQKSPTDKQALICISNLRNSNNTFGIENEIIKATKNKTDIDFNRLIGSRNNQYELRKKLEGACDYRKIHESEYLKLTRYLAAHGRILDAAEIYFAEDEGIKYESVTEDYIRELKDEFIQKKKLNVKRGIERSEEKRNHNMMSAMSIIDNLAAPFFSLLLAIPFGLFGGIFSSMKKGKY